MGIYFRDILLIRISRGANNCGQHSLEKNIYFTMRFSPHSQLFYFNDRLEFCEFFEWKIKRINNADLFSQPPLLIFIKGANISGGHCTYFFVFCFISLFIWIYISNLILVNFNCKKIIFFCFFLKVNLSCNWFVQNADSYRNYISDHLYEWVIQYFSQPNHLKTLTNTETPLLFVA